MKPIDKKMKKFNFHPKLSPKTNKKSEGKDKKVYVPPMYYPKSNKLKTKASSRHEHDELRDGPEYETSMFYDDEKSKKLTKEDIYTPPRDISKYTERIEAEKKKKKEDKKKFVKKSSKKQLRRGEDSQKDESSYSHLRDTNVDEAYKDAMKDFKSSFYPHHIHENEDQLKKKGSTRSENEYSDDQDEPETPSYNPPIYRSEEDDSENRPSQVVTSGRKRMHGQNAEFSPSVSRHVINEDGQLVQLHMKAKNRPVNYQNQPYIVKKTYQQPNIYENQRQKGLLKFEDSPPRHNHQTERESEPGLNRVERAKQRKPRHETFYDEEHPPHQDFFNPRDDDRRGEESAPEENQEEEPEEDGDGHYHGRYHDDDDDGNRNTYSRFHDEDHHYPPAEENEEQRSPSYRNEEHHEPHDHNEEENRPQYYEEEPQQYQNEDDSRGNRHYDREEEERPSYQQEEDDNRGNQEEPEGEEEEEEEEHPHDPSDPHHHSPEEDEQYNNEVEPSREEEQNEDREQSPSYQDEDSQPNYYGHDDEFEDEHRAFDDHEEPRRQKSGSQRNEKYDEPNAVQDDEYTHSDDHYHPDERDFPGPAHRDEEGRDLYPQEPYHSSEEDQNRQQEPSEHHQTSEDPHHRDAFEGFHGDLDHLPPHFDFDPEAGNEADKVTGTVGGDDVNREKSGSENHLSDPFDDPYFRLKYEPGSKDDPKVKARLAEEQRLREQNQPPQEQQEEENPHHYHQNEEAPPQPNYQEEEKEAPHQHHHHPQHNPRPSPRHNHHQHHSHPPRRHHNHRYEAPRNHPRQHVASHVHPPHYNHPRRQGNQHGQAPLRNALFVQRQRRPSNVNPQYTPNHIQPTSARHPQQQKQPHRHHSQRQNDGNQPLYSISGVVGNNRNAPNYLHLPKNQIVYTQLPVSRNNHNPLVINVGTPNTVHPTALSQGRVVYQAPRSSHQQTYLQSQQKPKYQKSQETSSSTEPTTTTSRNAPSGRTSSRPRSFLAPLSSLRLPSPFNLRRRNRGKNPEPTSSQGTAVHTSAGNKSNLESMMIPDFDSFGSFNPVVQSEDQD